MTMLSMFIRNADKVICEGYEMDSFRLLVSTKGEILAMACSDDPEFLFADQEVDIDNGLVFAEDEEGETRELRFWMERPMTEADCGS